MRKILIFLLVFSFVFSLCACSSQENLNVEGKQDEIIYVELNGIIEDVVVFDSFTRLTVKIDNESKVFQLSNSKHVFDDSHNPKVEPYLKEGVYVKIRCSEKELTKNTPNIDKITITSYDGIFVV